MTPLISLLILILVLGLVLYLVLYLIDMLPIDGNFKLVAKAIIILIAILVLLQRTGLLNF